MRKRVHSAQKSSFGQIKTVALAINRQSPVLKPKPQGQCPPRPSKHPHDRKQIRSQQERDIQSFKIKEFPNPLMKELRRLVVNQIDSGDRLYRSLISQQHKAALKLYSEDRWKLIQYLNSLAIRQVNIDNIKLTLQKHNHNHEHRNAQIFHEKTSPLEKTIQVHDKTRKRCKSAQESSKQIIDVEIQQVKKKLRQIEKGLKRGNKKHSQLNKASKKNILDSSQQDNIQKNILQATMILQTSLKKNQVKEGFVLIQKIQVQNIIQRLSHGLSQVTQKINNISKQFKNYKEQTLKATSFNDELTKKLAETIQLNQLKQGKQNKHSSHNYEQLSIKVNKLYDQLSQLVTDIQSKDEIIEYMKLQNDNLRNDLLGVEDLNKVTKSQYRAMTEYLQSLQERLKFNQDQLNNRQQQILALRTQISRKEEDIVKGVKQLRSVSSQIQTIKVQFQTQIQSLEQRVGIENEQKQLLKLERDSLKIQIEKLEQKLKELQIQIQKLQKVLQKTQSEEQITEMNIQYLKQHLQRVKGQNIQLFKKIQQKELNNNNISDAIVSGQKQQQKQQPHQTTPAARSLSMQMNQSDNVNVNQFDILDAIMITPIKTKTLSQAPPKQFLTDRIFRLEDSITSLAEVNKKNKNKKKKKTSLTEIQNAYQSDDEARVSSQNQEDNIAQQKKQNKLYASENLPKKQSQNEQSVANASKKSASGGKQAALQQFKQIQQLQESQSLRYSSTNEVAPIIVLPQNMQKPLVEGAQAVPHIPEQSKQVSIMAVNQDSVKTVSAQSKISKGNRPKPNIFIKYSAPKNINLVEHKQKTQSCYQGDM